MPEKRRLDYLGECNEFKVPIEDFTQQFCARCIQPDCTRSRFGKDKFDQRVQTWEERLFTQVPTMDPSDPRYEPIRNVGFQLVMPSLGSVSTTAWDGPASTGPVPSPVKEVKQPEPVKSEDIVPSNPEVSSEVVQSDETQPGNPPSTHIPRHILLINTPPQPGRMLQSGVPLTKPSPKDGWVTPQEPGAPVVKPGTKIKLGGGE